MAYPTDTMTDTPTPDLIEPEHVDNLAKRLDGAQCTSACGTMNFCMCAYAADCVDTMRALSASLLSVCKREAAMYARYDAKLEAAEAERDAALDELQGAQGQIADIPAARIAELQAENARLRAALVEAQGAMEDVCSSITTLVRDSQAALDEGEG